MAIDLKGSLPLIAEPMRTVVTLYGSHSLSEIAELLGQSKIAIYRILQEGLAELRQRMGLEEPSAD